LSSGASCEDRVAYDVAIAGFNDLPASELVSPLL